MGFEFRKIVSFVIAVLLAIASIGFLVNSFMYSNFYYYLICVFCFVAAISFAGIGCRMSDVTRKRKIKALKYVISLKNGYKDDFVYKFGKDTYKFLVTRRVIKDYCTGLDIYKWHVTPKAIEEIKNY